mmetsp:Transcript_5810/g.12664  ORF Transcript_5810/g.12664 Transcript_5810/m.12664 type:complete len:340 (+) Transcript_5810:682-1701(+)
MNRDRREVALLKQLVELDGALNRLYEDNHLVELERIEQLVELAVLLVLGQLDVVLLEAVQGELGIVHVDLHRVLHELLADDAHLWAKSGREHHHLLLMRGRLEDLLHVLAHVELLEHLVALVEDEVLDVLGDEVLVPHHLQHTSRRADDNVRRFVLQDALVLSDRHATVEDGRLDVGQVSLETVELVVDLVGQLARVAEHKGANLRLLGLELMQAGEHEDGRLTHSRLGLAEDVHAEDRLRDALVLHLGRVLEAAVDDSAQQLRLEQEVAEAGGVDARVGAAPDQRKARRHFTCVHWRGGRLASEAIAPEVTARRLGGGSRAGRRYFAARGGRQSSVMA